MTTTTSRIARLNELINHTPDCSTDPHRPDDAHDAAIDDTRILLAEIDERSIIDDCSSDARYELRDLIRSLIDDPYARDFISTLALSLSLCPLHLIDYAACFDDENDECAAIRTIFPSHDT